MSVDVIGPLYNDEGDLLTGWHVNVTPDEVTPELEPFVVTPSRLRRVWAGDDPVGPEITVALRFADEAEALTFFPPAEA
jgi:hypothetical protein